jgi:predicted XRE-type DNA-binding protein
MSAERQKPSEVVVSCGNVFADLALENADEELAKAQLALAVRQRIQAKGLGPVDLAALLGTDPGEIATVMDGRAGDLTYDRLLRLLNTLEVDVRIVVEPAARNERGRISVVTT